MLLAILGFDNTVVREYLQEEGEVAWSLFVTLQIGGKPQTGQQWPNGAPQQQAGSLARGAHWGHLGAMGVDPRLVVKGGGVLLMAMAERPAVTRPQSFH